MQKSKWVKGVQKIVLMAVLACISLNNFAQNCVPAGNEVSYGTNNSWIGYLYEGKNFTTYKGYINRGGLSGIFKENFGTIDRSNAPTNCPVTSKQFSARFRMRRSFTSGTYKITVAGEGGYRLSFDGGNTWKISQWQEQSLISSSYSVFLKGSYDMVLEYFEMSGSKSISFDISASILPLSLRNWSASALSTGKVRLSWVTDAVVDFDHFILQRSTNGSNFTTIQVIANKNSTNNISYTYEYFDQAAPKGVVYYRLAMVDRDETVRYSDIKTVSLESGQNLRVYPSIVENGQFAIRSDKSITNAKIEIVTLSGQTVQTDKWSQGTLLQKITIRNNLGPNSYFVRLTDDKGAVEIRKIIIQ